MIDPLVEMIRVRVAERRKAGLYPEGLEEELDAHFKRIVAHRHDPDLSDLRSSLDVLAVRGAFSRARIPLATTVPGGDYVHRVVGKVISRQTQGVLEQMQGFADVVRETFDKVADALAEPYSHVHSDLVGQLDAIWERLAAWERGPVESPAAVADLRRRVERLEAAEESRQFNPPFSASEFESAFRGSTEDLKDRYQELAEVFAGREPVLDIGCGRGEFLELLQANGVAATGVEIDPTLVAEGRAGGLEIASGDGVVHLASLADNSLGGVAMIQVIEHLTRQQVVDVVAIAGQKVRPGGVVVVETVNPQSLYTFAHSFYVDPTHSTPVHPAYLKFVFEQAGWGPVHLRWRTPPPEDDVLQEEAGAGDAAAANIGRLNQLLFAPQDYAIVAYR
jgi:SAM-dependent methyltransferase